jgi:hypothetical protein
MGMAIPAGVIPQEIPKIERIAATDGKKIQRVYYDRWRRKRQTKAA